MSLAGCMSRWPYDDTLPVVGEDARAGVRLQDRGPGLLDLQNERISGVGRKQEQRTGRADAPDADYLNRGVLY